MFFFTSLDVKLKIWLGSTSQKFGRNSAEAIFKMAAIENGKNFKMTPIVVFCCVIHQNRGNLGLGIQLWHFQVKKN